jgi:hypothetical protein
MLPNQRSMTTTTISKEFLDELLSGLKRPEYLLGDKGLMKELMARLMERMLGAELTEHLGYEPHGGPTSEQTNRRNGATRKVLKGNDGAVPIEPRAIAPLVETAFRLPGKGWQFRAGADPERPDPDRRDG